MFNLGVIMTFLQYFLGTKRQKSRENQRCKMLNAPKCIPNNYTTLEDLLKLAPLFFLLKIGDPEKLFMLLIPNLYLWDLCAVHKCSDRRASSVPFCRIPWHFQTTKPTCLPFSFFLQFCDTWNLQPNQFLFYPLLSIFFFRQDIFQSTKFLPGWKR